MDYKDYLLGNARIIQLLGDVCFVMCVITLVYAIIWLGFVLNG